MSTLTKVCGTIPTIANMDINCANDYEVGFPKAFIFGKYSTSITAVGDTPTPDEVQTYLDAGNGIYIPITNGKFIAPELQTKSGADTYDNQEEVISEVDGVEGTIRKITNNTLEMFRQTTLNNSRMRVWVVDSKNRWHGEKEGYIVPFYIPEFQHDGFGEQSTISRKFTWNRNIYKHIEISDPDDDYTTLENLKTYSYVENVVSQYTLGDVSGYENLTGWDKETYPLLYFQHASTTVTISSDLAGSNVLGSFTAGTGTLTVSGTITGTLVGNHATSAGDIWTIEAVEL